MCHVYKYAGIGERKIKEWTAYCLKSGQRLKSAMGLKFQPTMALAPLTEATATGVKNPYF